MLQYKVIKGAGLDKFGIDSLRDMKSSIIYFHSPDKKIFEELKTLYQADFCTLFYEEKEAKYANIQTNEGIKYTSILLLYPKERSEKKLGRMVDSLLLLKFESSIFIITEEEETFILEFLNSCNESEISIEESLIGILNTALGKMTEDARKIRDNINELEETINKWGPTRHVFNNLLQLKKHLITLKLTYDSDDRIIEFFKREQNSLRIKKSGRFGIVHLEEKLDTLTKLVDSYDKYLEGLDTMINSLSSFRLNAIMKTLTEISIILTVPTMVYGFWGINLKLPFEDYSFGFILVILVSIFFSGIIWYWIRKIRKL